MEEGEKKPDAGTISGIPQKKIVYAVIAIAVVILAVVLIAKFGYNSDLLNPAGGQMSLVQRPVSTIVPLNTITVVPTTRNLSYKVPTPQFQQTTIPRYQLCPAGTNGCSGKCLNLSFDNGNCGSCGNTCNVAIGGFCSQGTCCYPRGDTTCEWVVCESGYSCCSGRCVPGGP
jgi:hypothetical protein